MRFLKIVFLLFVILIIGAGGFAYWIYNSLNAAVAHDKSNQYIQIQRGASPNEILDKLRAEGVLQNEMPTQLYLRFTGKTAALKSGDYRFQSPITPIQVIEKLQEGEERSTKFTIIEGWTRWEISKEIAAKFPPAKTEQPRDPNEVLALLDDASLIKDFDPTAKNLEGYLYPDTYNFPREFTPKQVVKALVDRFKREWKPEYTTQAQTLGRTPKEIVTIASLIETESKIEAERPNVASVIYNRLNRKMALGLDQSNVYAAKIAGVWDGVINKSDVERESPYNLRKVQGLPPTPIASPNISSIRAALNPNQTDYIYYVLNVEKNDGSHHFYNNAADFERGKAAYQTWLAAQR
ncbi:MAG: endolytic transglycosylase MltG [Pyrinomonadaceae bacterium]|nr:endolytic transglycosylase MltG [Pyrinomonadaceae bacterium]